MFTSSPRWSNPRIVTRHRGRSAGLGGAEQGGSDRHHPTGPAPARADQRGENPLRTTCPRTPVLPIQPVVRTARGRRPRRRWWTTLWAALQVLASPTAARATPVAVRELRRRLLDTLDVFGVDAGRGRDAAGREPATRLRPLLRRVSCIDDVVDRIESAGAQVRYRRVLDAVAELETLAVTTGDRRIPDPRRHRARPDGSRPGRRRGRGLDLDRCDSAAASAAHSLAALQPWTAGGLAPRVWRRHRQGFAAVMVEGQELQVTDQDRRRRSRRRRRRRRSGRHGGGRGTAAGCAGHQSRRDVVLVTGPWLAGVSSVAAALRRTAARAHVRRVERSWRAGEAPTGVVFVVSASAADDRIGLHAAGRRGRDTDAVMGVVAKIDVHFGLA